MQHPTALSSFQKTSISSFIVDVFKAEQSRPSLPVKRRLSEAVEEQKNINNNVLVNRRLNEGEEEKDLDSEWNRVNQNSA